MERRQGRASQGVTQADFASGYIWVALIMAMGVGFTIGAHLAFTMGLGFRVGKGLGSFIQTHGHVQLIGWTGLFIMGISLHFLPRLAGVPIASPVLIRWILWCMTLGLGLRSLGQPVLAYLHNATVLHSTAWLLVSSGILTWSGIFLYVFLLLRIFSQRKATGGRPALVMVRPYVGMMCIGWMVYASLDLALLVHMALQQEAVLQADWHRFAIDSMVGLVLLPVAFAVSVRTLPLYLRLAPPDWPVHHVAYAYGIALAIQLLPTLPPLLALAPPLMSSLSQCGTLAKSGVMLWFVWQLDVLTRRRDAWIVRRKLHPGAERRPTRPGLPDYGEFGCFERLIYTAYLWLVLAALCEGLAAVCTLLASPAFSNENTARHMYLLGFITLLIFGMAVRMLPGFWQQRRIAMPGLVKATFWLGNAAVFGRVLLFLLPVGLYDAVPGSLRGARIAFALSGLLGLVAVACLAGNLWKTAQAVRDTNRS
jgi:uncharacterized protein involved in response to NO